MPYSFAKLPTLFTIGFWPLAPPAPKSVFAVVRPFPEESCFLVAKPFSFKKDTASSVEIYPASLKGFSLV